MPRANLCRIEPTPSLRRVPFTTQASVYAFNPSFATELRDAFSVETPLAELNRPLTTYRMGGSLDTELLTSVLRNNGHLGDATVWLSS
jgi:hypothetical protein